MKDCSTDQTDKPVWGKKKDAFIFMLPMLHLKCKFTDRNVYEKLPTSTLMNKILAQTLESKSNVSIITFFLLISLHLIS